MRRASLILCLFLASCLSGGGGSPVVKPDPVTPKKLLAYAVSNPTQLREIVDSEDLLITIGPDILYLLMGEAHDKKVVLNVSTVFFTKRNVPILRPDYVASWYAYVKAITPYRSLIAAFYPIDEPYWSGFSNGISAADVKKACEMVNGLIKASFPEIPIAVIEAEPMVNSALVIPNGYDWIGFDHYGDFAPVPGLLATLKSKVSPTQRILLVGDGLYFGTVVPTEAQQGPWVDRAAQYYNLAISDPQIMGILVYEWSSEASEPYNKHIGVRDMPLVRAAWATVKGKL